VPLDYRVLNPRHTAKVLFAVCPTLDTRQIFWRTAYVITAILALYLNVFVLVIQSFIKIPALHALAPAVPPAGPVFGAVQGVVLIAFLAAGWLAVKAGRAAA